MTSKLQYLQKYLAKPGQASVGTESKPKKEHKSRKKPSAEHRAFQIHDVSEVLPRAREDHGKKRVPVEDDDTVFVDEHLVAEAQKVDAETSGVRWRIQQHRRPQAHRRKVKEEEASADGSDLSPPRARARGSERPPQARGRCSAGDDDLSPPRAESRAGAAGGPCAQPAAQTPGADSDMSPPRAPQKKATAGAGGGPLPQRGAEAPGADSDMSPPRAPQRNATAGAAGGPLPQRTAEVPGADSDMSPPRAAQRKATAGSASGSPRALAAQAPCADSDPSPPRAGLGPGAAEARGDLSPPRAAPGRAANSDVPPPHAAPRRGAGAGAGAAGPRVKEEPASEEDPSPPRRGAPRRAAAPGTRVRHDSDAEDLSPPRRPARREGAGGAAGGGEGEGGEGGEARMSSGLRAGLVKGEQLRDEAARVREERRAAVEAAPAEETGRGATTVYRDKSGRKISREEWVEQRQVKRKKRLSEYPEQELEWGGGLKQRATKEEEMAEIERIAAQPFARMEPDARYMEELRERQDWNDPMRQMKAAGEDEAPRAAQEAQKKSRPKCPHPPWPNRFNIPPGYRWDGKVRGNAYEKRWLEARNQREFKKQEQWKYEMEEM